MRYPKLRFLSSWVAISACVAFTYSCAGGDEASDAPGGKGGSSATGGKDGGGGSTGDAGGTGGTGAKDGGGDGSTCTNPTKEVCDDKDNDCDGQVDEEDATDAKTWYEDKDGDNYGVSGATKLACKQPSGYAEQIGDCKDSDPAYHPGALENNCDDPNDYNCDGKTGYADSDADGFPACKECDDNDKSVYPGGAEICDGKDNDCDGSPDAPGGEGDNDGDGSIACKDCNDKDKDMYPGNPEICDGKDNDCNGTPDYTGGEVDLDGDKSYSCKDCDDADKNNYPGNTEICDAKDNDCNTLADFPGGEVDGDKDGVAGCLDCDDNDPNRFQGNPEICDGIDNDCNPATTAQGGETDADKDLVASCKDCNDNDPAIYPGNAEKCDGKDNNCNNVVDVDAPISQLCGTVANGTAVCNGSNGCGVQSCTADYYDVDKQFGTGCECHASPAPITTGDDCAGAINIGTLSDVGATSVLQSGNVPFPGREIWYTFNATDDTDTVGDEFHVDIRFTVNPSNTYVMDVYRNGCPGSGGTQLASGENDRTDWYVDFNRTNTPPGPCPGPLPCGEGNCRSPNQAGFNLCNNNTATFYVRVRSIGSPSCSSYTLRMSNGVF